MHRPRIDTSLPGIGDRHRRDFRVYLEPVLAKAASNMAPKVGVRTMSRYIRRAVVMALLADGYPLNMMTNKFRKVKPLYNGVSLCE